MDYEVVKLLIDILQFNYPETLLTAYVMNAPFLFWACWVQDDLILIILLLNIIYHSFFLFFYFIFSQAIIKLWLDPVTAKKVSFIKGHELKGIIPPG